MSRSFLFVKIRKKLAGLLDGYIQARELKEGLNDYVAPAKLGSRAGVIGSLVLAEEAFYRSQSPLHR
jgi:fructokinase